MKWQDLPESDHVADRRGVPEPETLSEMQEAGIREPQPERGAPYVDSNLARQIGISDVTKSPSPVVAVLRALAALLRLT